MSPALHRRTFSLGLATLLASPAIGHAAPPPDLMDPPMPELEELKWHPPIREAIQALANAPCHYSEHYNPTSSPYVVMDLFLIHISQPTSQAESSYAGFCLKKKIKLFKLAMS